MYGYQNTFFFFAIVGKGLRHKSSDMPRAIAATLLLQDQFTLVSLYLQNKKEQIFCIYGKSHFSKMIAFMLLGCFIN